MANQSERSTLTFLTESLPVFMWGEEASFNIEATGGVSPYNFRLREGTLPPNLNLSPEGLLSGIPEQPGHWEIMVTLRDAMGAEISQTFNVDVEDDRPSNPVES
jgi:hypothetical protein